MYFPFLRAKQFELLALKDALPLLSKYKTVISPIIEPVKDSSTLVRTLQALAANNINFNLILNPVVGDLIYKVDYIRTIIDKALANYSNFQISFNIQNENSVSECLELVKEIHHESFKGFTFVHNTTLNSFIDFQKFSSITYNVINFNKTSRRYHRNFPLETRVSLDDHFNLMPKNSHYSQQIDEPFTEEHLYYKEDGYEGFSDFLTIGELYSEGGFLPYAVVIHITYCDDENKIRIRHFVSDSNQDPSDIAGKFAEALQKLIVWDKKMNLKSEAMKEFRELHRKGHFPGLGTIKKLSIFHHLETVLTLIA